MTVRRPLTVLAGAALAVLPLPVVATTEPPVTASTAPDSTVPDSTVPDSTVSGSTAPEPTAPGVPTDGLQEVATDPVDPRAARVVPGIDEKSLTAAPVPAAPNGRTITLVDTEVEPGGTIRFTGTGYVATEGHGGGQVVTVKLNDADIVSQALADDDGSVAGTVPIPAALAAGGTYWLRFLAGTGQENDMPPSSIFEYFHVVAPAGSASTTTVATTTTSTTAGPATTTTLAVGGTGVTTTIVAGSAATASTTSAVVAAGSVGTTTTTVAGTLVNNGDDADRAFAAAGLLAVLGVVGLLVSRRLRTQPA